MHNNLHHLQTLPGEFTSHIAYKGIGPTSTDTNLWHQHLGHPGRDIMTLALRSADIIGAKYDSNVPLLSREPCILAKLHHAPINTQPSTKATASFHAFGCDIYGPLKETGLGGAKFLLGVIDNSSNYVWLLAIPSKKVYVSILCSVFTDRNSHTRPHPARTFRPTIKLDCDPNYLDVARRTMVSSLGYTAHFTAPYTHS
jgi:hypothetical protein